MLKARSMLFAVLLATGVVAPPAPARADELPAAPDAETQAIVTKVQAVYDKTQTFVSGFKQEYWVKAHNQKKTSAGVVTIQKPGKMDFQYSEPKDNRVVSDGAVLRLYEAANKQMVEQTIDKAQYPAALSFLAGTGKLAETFTFVGHPGESMSFPGGFVLEGKPRQENRTLSKVFFYVDKATNQVRRIVILDPQNNRNRFDFDTPRVNEPVKADQFKFTPPEGTQIIRP